MFYRDGPSIIIRVSIVIQSSAHHKETRRVDSATANQFTKYNKGEIVLAGDKYVSVERLVVEFNTG